MRRFRALSIMLVLAASAALVLASSASAAGWEKISRDGLDNVDEATTALSGSSVVVAWTYQSSPGTSSIEATTFSSSLADSVQSPVTVPVISDWPSLSSDPELLTAPDGSIVIAFDGTHSNTTGDPLDGLERRRPLERRRVRAAGGGRPAAVGRLRHRRRCSCPTGRR